MEKYPPIKNTTIKLPYEGKITISPGTLKEVVTEVQRLRPYTSFDEVKGFITSCWTEGNKDCGYLRQVSPLEVGTRVFLSMIDARPLAKVDSSLAERRLTELSRTDLAA